MSETCRSKVYRGKWSTQRFEACGKPAKGAIETRYGSMPACGIHLRSKHNVWDLSAASSAAYPPYHDFAGVQSFPLSEPDES